MNMGLQLETLKNVIMGFIRRQQSEDHNFGNRHDWSSSHRGPKVRKLSSYQSRSSKGKKVSISPDSKQISLRDRKRRSRGAKGKRAQARCRCLVQTPNPHTKGEAL